MININEDEHGVVYQIIVANCDTYDSSLTISQQQRGVAGGTPARERCKLVNGASTSVVIRPRLW